MIEYIVGIPDGDGSWKELKIFDTKEDAVKFIRETIDNCDDEGYVCLISECDDGTDEEEEDE